jgi:hypothetical protein
MLKIKNYNSELWNEILWSGKWVLIVYSLMTPCPLIYMYDAAIMVVMYDTTYKLFQQWIGTEAMQCCNWFGWAVLPYVSGT